MNKLTKYQCWSLYTGQTGVNLVGDITVEEDTSVSNAVRSWARGQDDLKIVDNVIYAVSHVSRVQFIVLMDHNKEEDVITFRNEPIIKMKGYYSDRTGQSGVWYGRLIKFFKMPEGVDDEVLVEDIMPNGVGRVVRSVKSVIHPELMYVSDKDREEIEENGGDLEYLYGDPNYIVMDA